MLSRVMSQKVRVAVLGATGVAGQQFLAALAGHPFFTLTKLGASERSAGKRYADALRDKAGGQRWYVGGEIPGEATELVVEDAATLSSDGIDLVFSALESDAARAIEPRLAADVPVLSTASAYRYEADVPILLPGVNPEHVRLLDTQRARRGWKGFIAPGPNCTTVGLAITLKPLHDAFGLERVVMTSMQAVSGAGRSPGVGALDILDNLIPFIANEEEKVEREVRKILGGLVVNPAPGELRTDAFPDSFIDPLLLPISCTCTRVPVLDGHTEAVFVATRRPAPLDEVKAALTGFGVGLRGSDPTSMPSLPSQLIQVHDDPYRPQPRLDRDAGNGMTTVVGRLRPETSLGPHGVKYVLLSHNTKMGAAAGTLLTAEQLFQKGYIAARSS